MRVTVLAIALLQRYQTALLETNTETKFDLLVDNKTYSQEVIHCNLFFPNSVQLFLMSNCETNMRQKMDTLFGNSDEIIIYLRLLYEKYPG